MDEKTMPHAVTVDRRDAFAVQKRAEATEPDLVIVIREDSPRGTRWTKPAPTSIRAFGSAK